MWKAVTEEKHQAQDTIAALFVQKGEDQLATAEWILFEPTLCLLDLFPKPLVIGKNGRPW